MFDVSFIYVQRINGFAYIHFLRREKNQMLLTDSNSNLRSAKFHAWKGLCNHLRSLLNAYFLTEFFFNIFFGSLTLKNQLNNNNYENFEPF